MAKEVLIFPAHAQRLSDARRFVFQAAQTAGLETSAAEDFLTAVDEAMSNAIKHGSPLGDKNQIYVTCHNQNGRFEVTIQDEGEGLSLSEMSTRMPSPDAYRGRGIPLMRALADAVTLESTPQGTTITLVKMTQSDYPLDTPQSANGARR